MLGGHVEDEQPQEPQEDTGELPAEPPVTPEPSQPPQPALGPRRWPEPRPGDVVIIGGRGAGEPRGEALRWAAVVIGQEQTSW